MSSTVVDKPVMDTLNVGTPGRGAALGSTVLERIGNTPMVRMDRLVAHLPGVTLLGKAEFANPGGQHQGPGGVVHCAGGNGCG